MKSSTRQNISAAYRLARVAYAERGVDTEAAIKRALAVPISLHCWQADDVRGLEMPRAGLDSEFNAAILAERRAKAIEQQQVEEAREVIVTERKGIFSKAAK